MGAVDRAAVAAIVLICGAAVLAYLNTLPAGFTFDDNFAVVSTGSSESSRAAGPRERAAAGAARLSVATVVAPLNTVSVVPDSTALLAAAWLFGCRRGRGGRGARRRGRAGAEHRAPGRVGEGGTQGP